MDNRVRTTIHDEMRKSGKMDKDYIVTLVKELDEKPDVEKLIEQHYKSKADRIISSFKDENGIRDCFAVRDNQNRTKYIDISKPNLLTKTEIELVRDKQIKLKKNKEEIILKANLAHRVLEGQLQMEDYEKTLKEQLKAK